MLPCPTPLGQVRYRVLGASANPWLVITHGLALDHRDLAPFAASLADRWRVLLWDMPGHGESQPFPPRFTAAGAAEALKALIDALAIDRASMLGFSFGGMVVQHLARHHPERLASFVAYGCFAPFSQLRLTPPGTVRLAAEAAWLGRSWEQVRDDFAARCALTGEGRATVRRAMAPLDKRRFVRLTAALLDAFEPTASFRLDCPVLFVAGAEDSNGAALGKAAAGLEVCCPRLEQAIIEGAGHCAHRDRPEAFKTCVGERLDRWRWDMERKDGDLSG